MLVIGAVVIGGVGGFVEVASAQTLTVDDDEDSDHDTIQDAVDNAESGDVIEIEPGRYNETVSVGTEDLELSGPNSGVDGADSRSKEARIAGQVIIEANQVTVDGLHVSPPNPVDETSDAEAIRVSSGADNVTIANNVIKEFARTSGSAFFGVDGINLFGGDQDNPVKTPSVRNNLVEGLKNRASGGAAGISIQGNVVGSEINQNTVRSVAQQETPYGFGIVVRGTNNHDLPPSDVTISENDISEILSDPGSEFSGVGIGIEKGETSSIRITANQLSGTDLLFEDKTASFELQQFASANSLDRGALVEGVSESPTRNVIFDSIQKAESTVGKNNPIDVLPGTYEEELLIDTDGVTLSGPNAGTPGDGDRGAEATIKHGVQVIADDVRIDGVEVTNDDTHGILLGPDTAPSEVVVTNTVVRDIEGDVGGAKAAGNGINLQFNDAFKQTSSGIEITNNLIRGISTPDTDGDSADAIGVQLLPRGNDVENLSIRGNVIADIQPGAADGRSEARAISIDTQFTNTSDGVRGDFGQATNLVISDNEVDNLTADFARAITLFEDKNGDTQDDTNLGPTGFDITDNIVSDVSSQSDDFPSLSIFVGEYPEFGAEHAVRQNILLAGVTNFGGSSDTLQATNNWWGATNGPGNNFEGMDREVSSFTGDGVGAGGNGDITVDPVSVSGGSADLATPFVGSISDPAPKLRTVADPDAGFTIEKIGAPADGTLVLEIAGTEYVFEDALDRGELTNTTSDVGPTAISDTATTGQRSVSVVGNDSTTALDETGTVRLVHEVQGIGSGYTLSSVPQPARIYTDNVSDITTWDNENGNFESTTATVDDGTLVTDGEALHNGQYFFGDAADARVGYDYLEDGESAIQVGAAGFETLGEGFHLIGSNYDTSSSNAPVSLDRDLATVKSLPDTPADYVGSESFVAYSVDSFAELGGDKPIGSFEAYWVYVDVGEDSETRVIKLARFNPSDA